MRRGLISDCSYVWNYFMICSQVMCTLCIEYKAYFRCGRYWLQSGNLSTIRKGGTWDTPNSMFTVLPTWWTILSLTYTHTHTHIHTPATTSDKWCSIVGTGRSYRGSTAPPTVPPAPTTGLGSASRPAGTDGITTWTSIGQPSDKSTFHCPYGGFTGCSGPYSWSRNSWCKFSGAW